MRYDITITLRFNKPVLQRLSQVLFREEKRQDHYLFKEEAKIMKIQNIKYSNVIILDVDSVLVENIPALLERYNEWYDDSVTKEDILDWDISQFLKHGTDVNALFADPTLYQRAQPVSGALEAVNYLRERRCRIIFATIPWPGTEGAKLKWLLDHGFTTDKREYAEVQDKSVLIADALLVDDNPKNLDDYGGFGFLFAQPWNARSRGFKQVIQSWEAFLEEAPERNGNRLTGIHVWL
jgi:5'(3')-deoxyribonucleotidase